MKCGEELDNHSAYCSRCGRPVGKKVQIMPVAIAKGAIGRIFGHDEESVFLDNQVPDEILKIVTNASREVVFVTPYLGLWVHLENAVEEAIARGVSVSFVVRAGERKQAEDLKWLRDHKIHVHEAPNLHAKIYLNESDVLVSSMNIYGHSTINSLDFAIMVRNENDAMKFREHVTHMTDRFSPPSQPIPSGRRTAQEAFCIRDGTRIAFNVSKPLCDKCYPKWARYRNKEYGEKYCHSCGRPSETMFARPLCLDCYRQSH